MAVLRNLLVVAVLAAAVAFVPGGGDTAAVAGAVLSTLILVSFVWLAVRFYRERRLDLDGLGDRWRAVLYVALALAVLTVAATRRLWDSTPGTLVWIAILGGACYAVYLVWRQYREYG
jgi:multisubunit Na+/H+ antiporter MnhB subunit